jgi:hypothetical protein
MHLIFVAIVIATVQPSNQMNTSEHQQTRSTIYDANVDGSNKTITTTTRHSLVVEPTVTNTVRKAILPQKKR